MKSLARRSLALFSGLVVSVSVLSAHPGHDDGHELTWDFQHLTTHPRATVLCVAVVAAAIWAGWSIVQSRRTQAQSLRGSQPSRGK
jgi:hydrogenase/urease accessory protein HupE